MKSTFGEGGKGTKDSGGKGREGQMLEVVAEKQEEFLESLNRRRIRPGGRRWEGVKLK